jgi:predicted transposase YdaD
MTGLWQRKLPDGFCCHDFRYRVIRAWEQRADETLAGDMAILPLAPLADDAKDRLPQIFEQLGERYETEPEFSNRQALWASTFALMGLRYTKELVMTLSQDRSILKESSFYQGILEEGSLREAKKMLRLVGSEKFGEPDSGALATIDQIHEVESIEELVKHVMRSASWQDLLKSKR